MVVCRMHGIMVVCGSCQLAHWMSSSGHLQKQQQRRQPKQPEATGSWRLSKGLQRQCVRAANLAQLIMQDARCLHHVSHVGLSSAGAGRGVRAVAPRPPQATLSYLSASPPSASDSFESSSHQTEAAASWPTACRQHVSHPPCPTLPPPAPALSFGVFTLQPANTRYTQHAHAPTTNPHHARAPHTHLNTHQPPPPPPPPLPPP